MNDKQARVIALAIAIQALEMFSNGFVDNQAQVKNAYDDIMSGLKVAKNAVSEELKNES